MLTTLELFKYIQKLLSKSQNNEKIKNILMRSQINNLVKNYNDLINLNEKYLNVVYPPLEINNYADLNNYKKNFQLDKKNFNPIFFVDHVVIENTTINKHILVRIDIAYVDQNIGLRNSFSCNKCNRSVLVNCKNNNSMIEKDTKFFCGKYKCKECVSVSNIRKKIYNLEMKN